MWVLRGYRFNDYMGYIKPQNIRRNGSINMKKEDIIIVVAGVLIFIMGLAIGASITEPSFQREAVRAGVAEWVASKSGSAEFKFKNIQN